MSIYQLHKLLVLKGDSKTDIVHSIVVKLPIGRKSIVAFKQKTDGTTT
jgi:hypothetical protein